MFGRKERPIVKYRNTLLSSVKKRLNRSRCRLSCGLGYGKESCVRWDPQVLRDVVMATNFWLSMGYNYGCMIASDTRGVATGVYRYIYPPKISP